MSCILILLSFGKLNFLCTDISRFCVGYTLLYNGMHYAKCQQRTYSEKHAGKTGYKHHNTRTHARTHARARARGEAKCGKTGERNAATQHDTKQHNDTHSHEDNAEDQHKSTNFKASMGIDLHAPLLLCGSIATLDSKNSNQLILSSCSCLGDTIKYMCCALAPCCKLAPCCTFAPCLMQLNCDSRKQNLQTCSLCHMLQP